MPTFGQLLKDYRKTARLTQVQLARRIDCDGSYIARLEMDERHPSRGVVLRLAEALALTDEQRDQLLAAALHIPEGDLLRLVTADGIDPANPAIRAVVAALRDPDLTPGSRDLLGSEIAAYVKFRTAQLKQAEASTL